MDALEEVNRLATSFPVSPPLMRYFIEGDAAAVARALGAQFWPNAERGYANFLHAYAALFAIPLFVREALARQPDRFSRDQLPHTIASTSGFILDAFGFDRRMNRPRDVIYSPAPTIRASHSPRVAQPGSVAKQRISDAAMIYFGFHLVRAAEGVTSAETVTSDECRVSRKKPDYHFDYFRSFFLDAGYHFPETREEAERYCARTDDLLAAEDFAPLWDNLLHAGVALQVEIGVESIARFLLPESAACFGEWQRKRPSRN